MKLIQRLFAYPFVLSLMLIAYTFHAFRNSYFFLKYGGEWNTYAKDEKKTIQDIYLELKREKLRV